MNKKAFTLTELLAVIVIISVVALIAVPRLINSIKNSNIDSYNNIIEDVILAANSYANNKHGILVQISVATLQSEGYLPLRLKNPVDNTELHGCVYVVGGDSIYKEEDCSTYLKGIDPTRIIETDTCDYANGYTWEFDYTGSVQEFIVPCDGTYKLEVWGAQGGYTGGKGAYTAGNISLIKDANLFVYVGQAGEYLSNTGSLTGGYNGGGSAYSSQAYRRYGAGGGATDIRYFGSTTPTTSDLVWNSNLGLNSRIMVAAGGGGHGYYDSSDTNVPGAAGGLNGYTATGSYSGVTSVNYGKGQGGKQYEAGWTDITSGTSSDNNLRDDITKGGFGYGGSASQRWGATGGGAGYYGGGGSLHVEDSGGGSSYISGHIGSLAISENSITEPRALKSGCTTSTMTLDCSIHYSNLKFTDTVMIDGAGYAWTTTKAATSTGMPKHDGTEGTMTGNTGNGFARITLISY